MSNVITTAARRPFHQRTMTGWTSFYSDLWHTYEWLIAHRAAEATDGSGAGNADAGTISAITLPPKIRPAIAVSAAVTVQEPL